MTSIRLTAVAPGRWLLFGLGAALSLWFAWWSLAAVVAPGESWGYRALAVVFSVLFLGPLVVLPATARGRLRRLEIDDTGIRLLRGGGAVFTELRWSEVSGVGMMVDEALARRELSGSSWLFQRIMYRVPPWLEVVPAGPDAVRDHPELGELVPAGDGMPPRWMVRLNEGWARRPDVGAVVDRVRPDLWIGERHGSTPGALLPMTRFRRNAGLEPPAPAVEPEPWSPPVRRRSPGRERCVELPRGPRVRTATVTLAVSAIVLAAVLALDGLPSWVRTTVSVPALLAAATALLTLARLRRPVRLVADDDSLRLVRGAGAPDWRVPWSDAAAVRMERRGDRATLFVRPTGPAAVEAHPPLRDLWKAGGRVEWRLSLGPVGVQAAAVRDLVRGVRPDLWSADPVRPG